MNRLAAYNHSLWLAEPNHFQRIASKVMSFKECYSAREVAKHRQKMHELALDLPNRAIDALGIDEAEEVRAETPKAIRATKGKVGVIPILGPVDQHESSELMKAGGTSIDFVSLALDAMLAKADIGAIVLHMDCPGGGCYGVQELSDKIHQARARKPIYAMADSMAASAGYWIASAANMVIATPGGDVGSVGVYVMHADESKALEAEGVSVTMIHAGKHKVEFAPYSPLSDDAKAEMQSRVDSIYDKFIKALSRNRGAGVETVRESYGQGRVMAAERALATGMIDRVMSFEQLMGKLIGTKGTSSGPTAEVLKLRNEWHKRRRASSQGKRWGE